MSCITGRRAANEHRHPQTHRQGALRQSLVHRRRRRSSGVASLLIAALGKTGFNVGALTWLTTIIAFGVMLALYGIMNERKEHALQFVLSLPLSHRRLRAREAARAALCFLVPWLVARARRRWCWSSRKPDVPDGLLPYAVLLCVFMLANFSVVLCGALHAHSEASMTAVIVVTNMAVTLFMFTVGAMHGINEHM